MVKAIHKQAEQRAKTAARMPHQASRALRTLMEELLQASEKVRQSWESWQALSAGSKTEADTSDLLAALDVQVYVLGRKCDSVTSELEAIGEAMPEDSSDDAATAATVGAD